MPHDPCRRRSCLPSPDLIPSCLLSHRNFGVTVLDARSGVVPSHPVSCDAAGCLRVLKYRLILTSLVLFHLSTTSTFSSLFEPGFPLSVFPQLSRSLLRVSKMVGSTSLVLVSSVIAGIASAFAGSDAPLAGATKSFTVNSIRNEKHKPNGPAEYARALARWGVSIPDSIARFGAVNGQGLFPFHTSHHTETNGYSRHGGSCDS